MSSLNSCSFIGRVGKDVESKDLDTGKKIATFTLAVSERYKDKSGDQKEETTWLNCVSFGKLAEIIEKYVVKGDLLYINGKLNNRTYEKDGVTKYFTEIVVNDMKMLGGRKGSSSEESVSTETIGEKKAKKAEKKQESVSGDDGLPF